jgi:hypothetical protein
MAIGYQPSAFSLRHFAIRYTPRKQFQAWCLGWSTALAVQSRIGYESALAAEVKESITSGAKAYSQAGGTVMHA